MIKRDVKYVANFDKQVTERELYQYLQHRYHINMVVEIGEQIVGYAVHELFKGKLQIRRFLIDPLMRRRGLGTLLMTKLKDKLSMHRRSVIETCVSEKNLAGQLFLKKNGFSAIGVDREFFGDCDGYNMFFSTAEDPDPQICFWGHTPKNRLKHIFAKF